MSLLLRQFVGFRLALRPTLLGQSDQCFPCLSIARFDEHFRLVLGAYVVGWPHLLYPEGIGDGTKGVALQAEGQ